MEKTLVRVLLMNSKFCWCGNQDLEEFSADYSLCSKCGTLILNQGLSLDDIRVQDEDHNLYGKEYWLSHQVQDFGYPTIYERSRQDTPERCLYWLRTLMSYKLPPGKTLELGCGHGSSVALCQWAGFEAKGLELSPWVVDFAKKSFDIPMLLGPIEDQSLEAGTLDAIVLYDVLEHLPDPFLTMSAAALLLKEDGFFIIQSPNYQENKSYAQILEDQDNFLSLMIPEHTYLFSRRAISKFFKDLGFNFLYYEPQLFEYDMYFIASRHSLVKNTHEQISHQLMKTPSGRLILALIDQDNLLKQVEQGFKDAQNNHQQSLQTIEEQQEFIDKLIIQKDKLTSELDQNQIQLGQSQEQLRQVESSCSQCCAELLQTQSDLNHSQSKLSESVFQLKQLQSQLKQAESQLCQSRSQLTQLSSKLNQAQLQNQNYEREQSQRIQQQLEDLQREIDAINSEIEVVKMSKFWGLKY
jgi:2-polyprenyl-3-methyl-5-hydroxy-6-metoxy-1,4-benzoquinol methylase